MKRGICISRAGPRMIIRCVILFAINTCEGDSRPRVQGESVSVRATDSQRVAVWPNVGDHVTVNTSGGDSEVAGFMSCQVAIFSLPSDRQRFACYVNIVVEEVDDDFDELLTEGRNYSVRDVLTNSFVV